MKENYKCLMKILTTSSEGAPTLTPRTEVTVKFKYAGDRDNLWELIQGLHKLTNKKGTQTSVLAYKNFGM